VKTKDGKPLYKRIVCKIILPEGHKSFTHAFKCPAKKGYTEQGVEEQIILVAEWLEKKYIYWEFRLVPTGPNTFSFIYAGLKKMPEPTQEPVGVSDGR
jgi:hypothetical protein